MDSVEGEFRQTLLRWSACELRIFQKQSGEFKQTTHFVKAEWGVDADSAFCKNMWEVEANSIFLENTVRSSFELRIFTEFKRTPQRRSLCELRIFQKQSGEVKRTAHFLNAEWGVVADSAFCKNMWEVESNSTFLENTVRSLFELRICNEQNRSLSGLRRGGIRVNSAFFKNKVERSSGLHIF